MNLQDYLQRIKRARSIARIREKSQRETRELRIALLRRHIGLTTDSASWDRLIEAAR